MKSSHLLLALLLLVPTVALWAQLPPAQADDPWPGFRGPDGSGRLDVELGAGPKTLQTRWIRSLGSAYSGIAVGGGLLVTAGRGESDDFVMAFDPEDGEERWRYPLEPAYDGHDGSHDGPIATPAIADGRVFMVGAAGRVAALRLSDGTELWTRHLVEDFGSEEPRYGFGGSPAVAGSMVVLSIGGNDDGSLAGFDVESGELLWRSLPDSIYSGSPIVAEVHGETQVLMLSPNYVTGLDPQSGKVLWQDEHGEKNAAMGALSQSVLPLGGERFFVKHGEDRVMVLEVQAGPDGFTTSRLVESRGLTKSYSPPSLVDGVLYGYTGRLLSAVDTASGALLWRSRAPGDGFLVALGDRLAVLTKKGTLHLGAADRGGWVEEDYLELFADLAWSPPSASGHSIYVRSLGQIARVDVVHDGTARVAPEVEPPTALRALADEIAAADGDPQTVAAAVDRFLAGRELPWVDGEDVLFLWRGEAEDVAIAGDMIGIRREEVMHRLTGSDLWWWQTRLDRRSRVHYLFFVDKEPAVDPSHLRRTRSTILGPDLDWQRDVPLEMSWLAMPDWPGRRLPGRGHLEEIEIQLPVPEAEAEAADAQPTEPQTKPARFPVWLPPGYDAVDERYPVIYVHHPQAREQGRWTETLDRAVGRTVAPVIVVFLETAPGEALAEVLVPAVDARFRTRAEAEARANVGMGFHTLTPLDATFQPAGVFGRLGIQSYFGIEQEMADLTALVGELTAEDMSLLAYVEWGSWDIHSAHEAADVRDSGRWLEDFLTRRGWRVFGGEMPDSTDFLSWNSRTELLLQTLFPIDGAVPEDELRRWLGTTAPKTTEK